MYDSNTAGATMAKREPVAKDVIDYACKLAERAEGLSGRVQGKLSPVMVTAAPRPGISNMKEDREYPPLFQELRGRFYVIENALDVIEDAMSRTEL